MGVRRRVAVQWIFEKEAAERKGEKPYLLRYWLRTLKLGKNQKSLRKYYEPQAG